MKLSGKKIFLLAAAALLFTGAAVCAAAQNKTTARPAEGETARPTGGATPAPAAKEDPARQASTDADSAHYSYEFTQPDLLIRHILVEHDAEGRGQVTFERKLDGEPIVEPLHLSPAALARINGLWAALRFLDSTTDYQTDKQFPHLGTIRLSMRAGGRERTAEFNYTRDRDAFALVNEYRRAADQVMFVFEITLARESQPLEAPKLMERLDALVTRGGLSDPKQLVPLVRDLSTDERLPLIARNHAGRILKKIEK